MTLQLHNHKIMFSNPMNKIVIGFKGKILSILFIFN